MISLCPLEKGSDIYILLHSIGQDARRGKIGLGDREGRPYQKKLLLPFTREM